LRDCLMHLIGKLDWSSCDVHDDHDVVVDHSSLKQAITFR
jgi:hypothetical protein